MNVSKKRSKKERKEKKSAREKGKSGKEKDEEKKKKERKKELVIEKGEREVDHEVDTQAELLTGGPGTIKDHGVETGGEAGM